MGKGYVDLTPPQRAAEAKRTRLLKLFGEKHDLKDAQERMRLIGEDNGLAETARLIAEKNAEMAEAEPQGPRPRQRKRKSGGGNKPMLPEQTIIDGKAAYNGMLDEDATWANNKTASAKRVIELLKLGDSVSVWTIKRWIVIPVLRDREQNKRRH
jgi:hypothetical protein